MSLNQLKRISGSAFRSLDSAMNATAQNVANMETEGYTRRRVTLQSESQVVQGMYAPPMDRRAMAAGVSVQEYERLRDNLLMKSAWEARSGLAGFSEEHRVLSTIEGILGASGESSLNRVLEDFYDGWAALADHPTDPGIRLHVRSNGEAVASTLNRLDASLASFNEEVGINLRTAVDSTNDLLREIASLNETIALARNQGAPDLSAEDRRDQLVDRLSEFAPVRVQTERREAFTITIDGMTVVQGSTATELRVDSNSGKPEVLFGDSSVALRMGSENGRIGALLSTIHQTIPSTRADLAQLAESIANDVNAIHASGYGLDGSTGVDFFDFHRGTEGFRISLSETISTDARAIAASSGNPEDGYADSEVARGIAGLRTGNTSNDFFSPADFFVDLVSGIGGKANRASSEASARDGVVSHLTALEAAVSGVNLEEEMTNLIRFQQAYAASARVLTTAQEIIDTLLRM